MQRVNDELERDAQVEIQRRNDERKKQARTEALAKARKLGMTDEEIAQALGIYDDKKRAS